MIVVFAYTGGITGAEVGVAGGTAALAQRVLEAVFGDDAVRRLAKRAKADLDARVEGLMAAELRRYHELLESVRVEADRAAAIQRASAEVEAARAEGDQPSAADAERDRVELAVAEPAARALGEKTSGARYALEAGPGDDIVEAEIVERRRDGARDGS